MGEDRGRGKKAGKPVPKRGDLPLPRFPHHGDERQDATDGDVVSNLRRIAMGSVDKLLHGHLRRLGLAVIAAR